MRKLTKTTIKPILKYIGNWSSDIHSLNTPGAKYYSFTLDTYNGKNSWQGGFDWFLDDALKYEMYALEFKTGNVYDHDKTVVMNINRTIQELTK
jgi:hypothetical protein